MVRPSNVCQGSSGRKTGQSSRARTLQRQHCAKPLALPVGQNVGKRDSAVKAAFGLFQKADLTVPPMHRRRRLLRSVCPIFLNKREKAESVRGGAAVALCQAWVRQTRSPLAGGYYCLLDTL